MVVWGYPCESKSSPAHYSKHPQQMLRVFFYAEKKKIKNTKISVLKNIYDFKLIYVISYKMA